MRLSRSVSVLKRRKNQLLGTLKTRKKHKRLDAICEKAYNRNHRGVKIELSECNDEGGSADNESELRRSTRVRRAPVVLDASPSPAKKRRRVDKSSGIDSVGVKRKDGLNSDSHCSTSKNVEEESVTWRSRLRSRATDATFGARKKKKSSPKGKRKLFEDIDVFSEEVKVNDRFLDDKEVELGGGMSTVVKSKRPGRIKASNVSKNTHQEIETCSESKEHVKETNEVEEAVGNNEVEEEEENIEVEEEEENNDGKDIFHSKSEAARLSKNKNKDRTTAHLVENEESEVPMGVEFEDCNGDNNVEPAEQDMEDEQPGSIKEGENKRGSVQVDGVLIGQVEERGCHDKPLEDDNVTKVAKKDCASRDAHRKLRIREGRRCGLCGTGTDGKPPKKLVQDGAGSDHEAYSGSSASEEPNYDVWDGFGNEPGWLGRLFGPINDRHGIAGIWVHQHCAVWSPEVYFAGLGCLKNVRAALCRGRVLKCTRCGRPGATTGCRVDRCPKTYHLPCARANGCIFDHRKFLIACTDHGYLFQPHGSQYFCRIKKMKAKKMVLEMRKLSSDAWRRDLEAEEKWFEHCGEDEEFLKRESKRLHRDLLRIAPVYIGGSNSENDPQFQGWESVAGLQDVIQCMKEVVILPLLYPEFFSNMGLTPPRGVLLHGYPGTGKTLVVRALIGSCARGDKRIAYFARKGADCLGKYVGDAERQLRLLFQVAEKSQPSIIFFDEIDGLAPCRTRQQDQTHNSVVSTLLALLDGLKSRGSVVVIGATNRPDAVDPALRRPGRFDREIYFPLPSVKDRAAILSLHTRKWPKPVHGPLLNWIARKTVGFAGADLQALCTQAAMIALRRSCPLQEIMSAAERKALHGKRPPLPTIAVEERDWLEALSCAPPPCSERGAGMAANDVLSSPIQRHLIPCLLQPLSRLLVSLHADERLFLPPPLYKAAALIKSTIVSTLDRKKVPSDHWWSHVNDLLQEADVLREIEMNLSRCGIVIGQDSDFGFDAWSEDINDDILKFKQSKVKQISTRTSLLQNMSYISGKKLGFRMLISGSPRSGQRYLASCLLHCFLGNGEIQKVDLATISQEGHGDVMQGVTQLLMRCASVGSCMIFMPRIDLWAMETCNQVDEEESDSSPEDKSFMKHTEVGEKENESCQKACELSGMTVSEDASQKASLIWSSFVEQVESICVSTSLMILATSEVPFPVLPHRIRQFFKSEILDCCVSTPSVETIPRFSVHLDGNFERDTVINSSAIELSKNLVQEFVQFIHHRTHVLSTSCMVGKVGTHEGDANEVCHSMDTGPANGNEKIRSPEASVMKVSSPPISRPPKGKSNLLLAISMFANQILRYPHFAELCWVTSKLKEGPCADINGPWKGWPFNSCVIRPSNLSENDAVACSSSDIKSKEKSGVVRGLIAVGLSAYRGMYTSLREVSSEVRSVLELLAGEINAKIQAGRDACQFIRLLSQMAYLEDAVNSWAYTLQSLEVDGQTVVPAATITSSGSVGDCKRGEDNIAHNNECKPDSSVKCSHEHEVLEGNPQRFDLSKGAGDVDPNSGGTVVSEGTSQHTVLHHLHFQSSVAAAAVVSLNEQNGIILESCTADNPGNHTSVDGHCSSFEHSNGSIRPNKLSGVVSSSRQEAHNQRNGLTTETGIPPEDGKPRPNNECNVNINSSSGKTTGLSNGFGFICFYRCCSECLFNLQEMMRKILRNEGGLKESGCSVEDVHDLVASLSVNLHSAVNKFFVAGSLPASVKQKLKPVSVKQKPKHDTTGNLVEYQEMDTCQCKGSEDRTKMLMECSCHSRSKKSAAESANSSPSNQDGFDLKFVYRDGVLSPVEVTENVTFHCKFETLCLCSLIEWIAMTKQPSDCCDDVTT